MILWVFDFSGSLLALSMAEEAESPVTPSVHLILVVYQREGVHASIEREAFLCLGFRARRSSSFLIPRGRVSVKVRSGPLPL